MIAVILRKIVKEEEGGIELLNLALEITDAEKLFFFIYNNKNLIRSSLKSNSFYSKKLLEILENFENIYETVLKSLQSIILDTQENLISDTFKAFCNKDKNSICFEEIFDLSFYCQELSRSENHPHKITIEKICQDLDLLKSLISFQIVGEGIATKKENVSFPKAFYNVKSNNTVKHYMNTSDNLIGSEGAFADIMGAIKEAKKCIFICGWQFEPQLYFPSYEGSKLFSNDRTAKTLGQILVDKAIDNPNLLIAIMPWMQSKFIKCENHRNALEYLKQIFKKEIKNSYNDSYQGKFPKTGLPDNLIFQEKSADLGFSRHLKMILVDTYFFDQNNMRKRILTGFYGSADLAEGRFDWHQHVMNEKDLQFSPIIEHLKKSKSYHSLGGYPRRPWREIVSRVEGPVTLDMLTEFVSRFLAGASAQKDQLNFSPEQRIKEFFNNIDMNFFISGDEKSHKDSPFFNCQLLRSSPRYHHLNEFWSVNKEYEKSIHKGYLHAIKQAENFIFIENQFLCMNIADIYSQLNTELTSELLHNKNHKFRQIIKNRIPLALVEKILEKHREGKPFHVFIVLPMLPEVGSLEDFAMWQIRAMQWLTMAWMIKTIEKVTPDWQQYLSFCFYGQWHGYDPKSYQKLYQKSSATRPQLALEASRGDIYVHSKMMLIDDRLLINGSANLNERSMRGDLDAEIAIYQWPQKQFEKECKELLQDFRLNLWTKYMGENCMAQLQKEGFDHPELPENIIIIRECAMRNLDSFYKSTTGSTAESGKLMLFPILKVDKDWNPVLDPQYAYLPDTPKYIIDKYLSNGCKLSDLGPYAIIPEPNFALSGLTGTIASMSRGLAGSSFFA